eukprot:GEMP01067985.1.p1 GENE.GEMP01067985.1~~GEMP01067985.1.p1  ORF type:complete len:415 (+),score=90.22 GEMP01067985.1:29-1246(+)
MICPLLLLALAECASSPFHDGSHPIDAFPSLIGAFSTIKRRAAQVAGERKGTVARQSASDNHFVAQKKHRDEVLDILFAHLINNRTLQMALPFVPEELRPIAVAFLPTVEVKPFQHEMTDYFGPALLTYHQVITNLTFSLLEQKDLMKEVQKYPDFLQYVMDVVPKAVVETLRLSDARHEMFLDFARILLTGNLTGVIHTYLPFIPDVDVDWFLRLGPLLNEPNVLKAGIQAFDDVIDELDDELELLSHTRIQDMLKVIKKILPKMAEGILVQLPSFMKAALATKLGRDLCMSAFAIFLSEPWNWNQLRPFLPPKYQTEGDELLPLLKKPAVFPTIKHYFLDIMQKFPDQIMMLLSSPPSRIIEALDHIRKAYPDFEKELNSFIIAILDAMSKGYARLTEKLIVV